MKFKETMLEEVLKFYNGKKRPKDGGVIPVYGGNGILDFCNDYNAEGDNIIIGRVGAYCGNVNHVNEKCWISDNAILVKTKDGFDSRFIYYSLINLNLNNYHIGSSQPLITQGILKSLVVGVPRLKEQKAIAHILLTLDEKIETNNQINKKLEEMAQTIFKHWFIDFEFPSEDGEQYKSNGGEMVESELGMIPKGWEVVELKDIADLTMGLSPKSSSYNFDKIGVPLLNGAADFENGLINATKYTTEPTRVCKKNDLVFCVRATIGNITFSDKEYCLGRGVASIAPKQDDFIGLLYISLLTSMDKLIANATGSVILGLSKPDINNMKLVLPEENILKLYSEMFKSILSVKHKNEIEVEKLTKLRDLLLPKLMSGEIRVPLKGDDLK